MSKESFRSTGESSHKLGLCEVCAEHCPEVFLRTFGNMSVYLFGHMNCLKSIKNEATAREYKAFAEAIEQELPKSI